MIHRITDGLTRIRAGASRWHGRAATAPRRILIVEDEPSMRDFVDRVLREAGYSTSRVVDGQEALEFAAQFGPFDLVLTDLVMPRMDGVELARRLRQMEPDLNVLFFTGYPDRLWKERTTLSEHEAFLDKSTTVEGLLEGVSLLVSGHAVSLS